jgi:hypothetical protein
MSYPVLALLIVTGSAIQGRAQGHDGHGGKPSGPQQLTAQQNDLVKTVRDATSQPHDIGADCEVP